ncbi:MAG TPA: MMPL family transporter [Syntrophorhabdaceae bacterium]|nr:MMPL family transporter [Syntrophorhabdaceae bacterium]HQM80357.1 MMPL family transporter [Syntrophorhabdaceae bacterium]
MSRLILRAQTAHPFLTFAGALVLAGLSALFTVTHLEFKTSQRALISSENRLMQMLNVAEQFSKLDAFIVAVENKDERRSLEFVRTLASRLEGDSEHFAQIFYRVDPAHFRPWALLYLKPEEIAELRNNLEKHKSFIQSLARSPGLVTFFEAVNDEMASNMVGELFTGFLRQSSEGGAAEPHDLDFLLRVLREMKANIEGSQAFSSPWRPFFLKGGWSDVANEGYFWTEGKKYLLVFVAPNTKGISASTAGKALTALRQAVAAAREQFPDVHAGVTGQKALDEDEKSLALNDISVATIVSLIGLTILLVVFWGTIRRPLLQMTTQVIGLSLTFGLTTLFIGHLNLLSVAFAPIVLGLGIDYDIHWFARYNEEYRRARRSAKQALAATMEKTGPAVMLAALSTCLAFLPLTFTGFKGLAELGLICCMGLFVSSITTVCLLPALIVLFDRPAKRTSLSDMEQEVRPLISLTRRRALVILALTAAGTGLSLWGAGKIRFDLNMLNLQSKSAESVEWEMRLIKGSKHPSIYGVLFARSLADATEKTEALKKLQSVSKVQSVKDFLPSDQDRKVPLVRGMQPIFADIPSSLHPPNRMDITGLKNILSRIRFKMEGESAGAWGAGKPLEAQMRDARSLINEIERGLRTIEQKALVHRLRGFEADMIADLNDKLSLLRESINTRPMKVSDLPRPVRDRFVGPDDLYLVRVFPAFDIWDPQFLGAFVGDLRSIDPDATGDPVTLYVFTREFRDASFKAAIYALALIFIFLIITLRSVALTLVAVAPLVAGALLTFGLMYLFGVDLNLANAIFLPLVIGAGVEYGVIIVQRWRQGKNGEGRVELPFSTGMGILLAGLTTTVGFGSLMISRHQGIYSLGLMTTVGSLTVLAVALLFIPALLFFLHGNKQKEKGRTENLGSGNN